MPHLAEAKNLGYHYHHDYHHSMFKVFKRLREEQEKKVEDTLCDGLFEVTP